MEFEVYSHHDKSRQKPCCFPGNSLPGIFIACNGYETELLLYFLVVRQPPPHHWRHECGVFWICSDPKEKGGNDSNTGISGWGFLGII